MHPLETYNNKPLDDKQLQEVRILLRSDPKLWRTHGNVAEWSREKALANVPQRTLQYECVQAGIQHMRNNFLKDGSSELERMMVEQIITHWLHLGTTSERIASLNSTKENLDELARLEAHYSQDQVRFNRAITLLTRTRKLLMELELTRRDRFTRTKHFSWENSFEPEFEGNLDFDIPNPAPEQEDKAPTRPEQIQVETVAEQPSPVQTPRPAREPRAKPAVPKLPVLTPRPNGGFYPEFPGVEKGSQLEIWHQAHYEEKIRNLSRDRINESEL
jgi:hypothetical protein